MIGTQADYARHIGVSRAAVSKMVKAKKIPVRADKKIDFAEADHARKNNSDPARHLSDDVPVDEKNEVVPQEDPGGPKKSGPTFNDVRTEREIYAAKIAELDLQERLGKILDRKDVENAMVAAGRKIRQGLDEIPIWADELDAAARHGGATAVRDALKGKVRALETLIVESLSLLVDEDS